MKFKYKHAILGGTFDRLHAGHKHFIEIAEKNSEKVTIGLVTDKFLGDRLHKDVIEPYRVREKELIQYLKSKNFDDKTAVYPLTDIFGPALKDPEIDMVLAIEESLNNAKIINRKRKKLGFAELKIVVVPLIKAPDGGLISSKRIRNGEIDRNGNSYLALFTNTLQLPEELRQELRKPFGKIIKNPDDFNKFRSPNHPVIAVGDIVVSNLVRAGSQANISIIDLKTQRTRITDQAILRFLPHPNTTITNKPSTIERDSVAVFDSALRKSTAATSKYTIEIDGEEDLLAIPAILLAPLGSTILYGIRDVGGVAVKVTESKKNQVKKILEKFKPI